MADNTTLFDLNDTVFDKVRDQLHLTKTEIDLINGSKLFVSLLHKFKEKSEYKLLYDADSNYYNWKDKIIKMHYTGTDFVRTLGHELGHFYDHTVEKELTKDLKNFDDIIGSEMDESQATAVSFIIRQQILLNRDNLLAQGVPANKIDISISNRIGGFTPTGKKADFAGGIKAVVDDLENRFGNRISASMTASDCWALVTEIAEYIWGENFLTRPGGKQNRWEQRLADVYTEIPIFLQSSERLFQSAQRTAGGQHQFVFKDADGKNRVWVYDGTSGSDLAEVQKAIANTTFKVDKRDLVVGREALNSNDTLKGGLGDDILRGGAGDDSFLTNYCPLFSAQRSETFCNGSM